LLPNSAYQAAISPERLIDLTNQLRENTGLNILTANQLLTKAAEEKGAAILAAQTFSHTLNDKRFSAWIRQTGYNYSYVGENLAIDFSTSEGVTEAWENSPAHKKNLLNPYYSEIGIAAVSGKFQGQDTTVVVQIFGAPAAGSTEILAPAPNFSFLSPGRLLPETETLAAPAETAEKLLTHSILKPQVLPANASKLALNGANASLDSLNKIVVQPPRASAGENFLLAGFLFFLIFSLGFICRRYILKINRLAAI